MSSSVPPPTYLANENRGEGYVVFSIGMAVLATSFVAGRFVSRALNRQGTQFCPRFWWDDWTALLSICMRWPCVATDIRMYQLGFGRHVWTIPSNDQVLILKYLFIVYFPYGAGLTLGRASALLFYSRVFMARLNKKLRYTIYAIHAMNISWLIGFYIAIFLQCKPVAKNWNFTMPGKCSSVDALWLGIAVPSMVIDVMILLLPLPLTWNLSMSKGKKLGLTIVFVCGYSTVVISVARVIMSVNMSTVLNTDLTYAGVTAFYWIVAEIPVTVISICLPAMLHLGQRVASHFSSLQSYLSSRINSLSSRTILSLRKNNSQTTLVQEQTEKEQKYYSPNLNPNSSTYMVSITGDNARNNKSARVSTELRSDDGEDAHPLSEDSIHMHSEITVVFMDNDRHA